MTDIKNEIANLIYLKNYSGLEQKDFFIFFNIDEEKFRNNENLDANVLNDICSAYKVTHYSFRNYIIEDGYKINNVVPKIYIESFNELKRDNYLKLLKKENN